MLLPLIVTGSSFGLEPVAEGQLRGLLLLMADCGVMNSTIAALGKRVQRRVMGFAFLHVFGGEPALRLHAPAAPTA